MRRTVSFLVATVTLAAALVMGAWVGPAHAVTLPSLTIGDVTMWEGDAGALVITIPVDLSAPSATKVTVKFSAQSDSATAGSDFVAKTGTLTFPIGVATSSVNVRVYGDTIVEPDEHIMVHLYKPLGATIAKADGGITVMDDDADGVNSGVDVNIGDVSVVEANYGTHLAKIPVTLSRPAPSTIKVAYALQCGSAESSDYSMTSSGVLTFLKGEQTKNLSFHVAANTVPEQQVKSIVQSIHVAKGPAVIGSDVGDGEIIDNDGSTPIDNFGLQVGDIRRVSVGPGGVEASPVQALCGLSQAQMAGSQQEAMSADGRYVAFVSDASNLVPDDTNFEIDTFVHDNQTGATERVSVKNDGSEFWAPYSVNEWQTSSDTPAISADGRYVTFVNENSGQLYLRDRVAQTTEMISVTADGHPGNNRSRISSISADGRYVAVSSSSTNLDPNATGHPTSNLYLRDRILGTTALLNAYAPPPGSGQYADYGGPAISANGRYVAFNDFTSTLVSGDTNNCPDTFVRDLVTGATQRVSVASDGTEQGGNPFNICSSGQPHITSDGRFIGFTTSGQLGPGSVLGGTAFVHDTVTGTTDLVSDAADYVSSSGPGNNPDSMLFGMSDDARYVVWMCFCGGPVAQASDSPDIVTMWTDRSTGETKMVGQQSDGTTPLDANDGWFTFTDAWGGVSADGSIVAFDSRGTNLIPDDLNAVYDVFIERMK